MNPEVTIEDITCEQKFRSSIENVSIEEANATCMRLIGEALLKNYTNSPNISTPHLLASTLQQACPGAINRLKDYTFKYMNCDAIDGICLASGCWENVFCWRKCSQCKNKTHYMDNED